MVLPDGRSPLGLRELLRDARADHLGEAVEIERLDAEAPLDLLAHRLAPGLGPEDPDAERAVSGVDPLALELVGDGQHVGGRAHDDVGLQVADQLHLSRGLPHRHGDHRAAETLGPVVGAEPAGEEPVAERHVKRVPRPHAGHVERPGDQLRPGLEVARRVADHGRLSGGAARRVHADQLVPRHGEEAEGVVVAQILLGGEGEARQVPERLEVLRAHARRVELRAVGGDVGVDALERLPQALELQLLEILSRPSPYQIQVIRGECGFRHLFLLCSVGSGAALSSESIESSSSGKYRSGHPAGAAAEEGDQLIVLVHDPDVVDAGATDQRALFGDSPSAGLPAEPR